MRSGLAVPLGRARTDVAAMTSIELDDLGRQRLGLETWLLSDDGRITAARVLRRRGLDRPADELVNEAWIRVSATLDRRDAPYPDMETPSQFARFGARVIDNLSRDWARVVRRAGEVELVESSAVDNDAYSAAENRLMLEQLVVAVSERARRSVRCVGCPDEVAVAAALEVVHMALTGQEADGPGRSWMDRMLHAALDRVDGGVERSVEARNQRKSRCGRCAGGLLSAALGDVVGATP